MFVDAVFPAFSELVDGLRGCAGRRAPLPARTSLSSDTRSRGLAVVSLRRRCRHDRLHPRLADGLGDRRTTAAGRSSNGTAAGSISRPSASSGPNAWFDRWGGWAVFLGRITPVVRSFISIPAGVFRHPLGRYTLLTFMGSTLWCLCVRRGRLGRRRELGALPPRVPLRRIRDRRAARCRSRLPRAPLAFL